MAKRLIVEMADGTVNVVVPTPKKVAQLGSEEAVLAFEVARGKVLVGAKTPTSHAMVDVDTLPNRTFRMAWEASGSVVTENIEKCRTIQMDNIKRARDLRLAVETENLAAAVDAEDATEEAAVRARRKVLRDIETNPTYVDALAAAATPAAVSGIWPTAEVGARQ